MNSKLKEQMLQKIGSGEIKMKPKAWFWLQKATLAAILFLTLIGSGMVLDLGYLWIVVNEPWGQTLAGEGGINYIKQDLPLMFFVLWMILFVSAVHIYKSLGNNYRKARISRIIIVGGIVSLILVILGLVTRSYLLELLLLLL